MAQEGRYDVRTEMLGALLEKLEDEQYPSSTILDMIEEMLTPDDTPVLRRGVAEPDPLRPVPQRPDDGEAEGLHLRTYLRR